MPEIRITLTTSELDRLHRTAKREKRNALAMAATVLSDALADRERVVAENDPDACPTCGESGYIFQPPGTEEPCPTCNGSNSPGNKQEADK